MAIRGHPKGKANIINGKHVATRKWQPKMWQPHYDQIVALSVLGRSNAEIAKHFKIHAVTVSGILNSEKGRELIEQFREAQIEQLKASISGRLSAITDRAISNMEAVIENDMLLETSPFAVFDRSFKFLQSQGTVKNPDNPNYPQRGNTFNVDNILVVPDRIAMELSEGARLIASMRGQRNGAGTISKPEETG